MVIVCLKNLLTNICLGTEVPLINCSIAGAMEALKLTGPLTHVIAHK